MDIHNEILTPKELAHLFVDGEISETERATLFRHLSEDVELQDYLAEVIRGEQIMEQYRIATTVPTALGTEIMAKAFDTHKVSVPSFAIADRPLRYGLVASIFAVILTGGLELRDIMPTQITSRAAARSTTNQYFGYADAERTTSQRYRHGLDITPNVRHSYINESTISAEAGSHYRKTYNAQEQAIEQATSAIHEMQAEQIAAVSVERIEIASTDLFEPTITPSSDTPTALIYSRNRNYFEPISKDVAVTIGGFGTGNSPSSPSRLAAMYIVNQEISIGLQYTARSYSAVIPINGGNEANPSAAGIEAIAQYVENSDVLPLGIKPVANFAAGYSRLGPTAFFFAGVSADAFDIVSLQTGIEGNAVFYDSRGSKMAAGGLRFAINAGIKF